MPDSPTKLSQFWQELKRRKVFKVIAIYAATAFIIMQVVDIMLPRLGLPNWTVTFIIILLIIGFPITIIFSWIFDVTPDGVRKTESVKHTELKNTSESSVRRGLKTSDGVIVLLLVIVCVLVYPKIFKKDKFNEIRDPDGKISIAVMPFENLSGDTVYNVWQGGFQDLLISTLSNSKELSVRQYQAMYAAHKSNKDLNYASITPSAASELALKLETRTFIIGKLLKAGDKIRINARLVNTETEEIFKTYQVDGNTEDDFFVMADSLSGLIKNYLEIEKLIEQKKDPDFQGSFLTNSAEAFQYFIHGWDAFLSSDYQSSREWFAKAIEADSSFISPYVILSLMTRDRKQAEKLCMQAYEYRDELPIKGKLIVDYLHAYFFENPIEQIKYLKQILEIEKQNTLYWYFLGYAHYEINQYEDAAIYFEKALDIHKKWGTNYMNPGIYMVLGESYHEVNEHEKEKDVYELGLDLFPDNPNIIADQTICNFSQGNTGEAEILLIKYESIRKDKSLWSESEILSATGSIYEDANLLDEAALYYRQALDFDSDNPARMHDLAKFLIDNDVNVNEGLELIQKALEQSPENWSYSDTKGWGLYKQGRYDEALKILTDAWELKPAYDYEGFQHIQEAKKALAKQKSEQ